MDINEYKTQIQSDAEKAHIEYNCRSTCCLSVRIR